MVKGPGGIVNHALEMLRRITFPTSKPAQRLPIGWVIEWRGSAAGEFRNDAFEKPAGILLGALATARRAGSCLQCELLHDAAELLPYRLR